MRRGFLILLTLLAATGLYPQFPEVHEEPFHQPLHSYGGFRYLRVEAAPGDTTALHFHRNPICYLTISGTEVWLDEPNGKSRTARLPTGWIGSDFYDNQSPFLHRFAVVDASPLLIIGVEKTGAGEPVLLPQREPVYASDGFLVFEISYESFQVMDLGGYPGIVSSGTLVAPSGEKRSPGYLILQDEDFVAVGPSVVWVVVPD